MKETRIVVKLGGVDHKLVYDDYAIMMLEEYLGTSVLDTLIDLERKPQSAFTVKIVAAAVLAGLQHDMQFAAGMDLRKACKLLPKGGYKSMSELGISIWKCISNCLGLEEYLQQTPEDKRADHPTMSPSEATGTAESTGESSPSLPAQQDASQPSSGV